MPPLHRFFRATSAERRLVLEAMLAVPLMRAALSLLPFRVVHRVVGGRVREWHGRERRDSSEQIIWAVRGVAARVPRASCLTQALAATLILARHGHAATLRVGVARDDGGHLRAHAWLESEGAPILGEPAPGAFKPFPPMVLS